MGVGKMKITIIGAGKTGRGFIARLLNGNEITFIDKNEPLVESLNNAKQFTVSFFAESAPKAIVSGYKAYTWGNIGKIDADLILVSVGGKNLVEVGNELKNRIREGQKIIVAENASHPAKTLHDAIGMNNVFVAESTVFCTTIEDTGLNINSESYPYLQYDEDAFGIDLKINGLKAEKGFANFLTRKLYTYNSASCIIAYLGYLKGYTVYSDAANDKEILELLDENYRIINECMCKEYGYDPKDQEEFALLSRKKFTDKTIVDTIARNAREPQRKITRYERVVGPLFLERKYGFSAEILIKTLAATLLYTPDAEKEWNEILKSKGMEGVLVDLCGIEEGSDLYKEVLVNVDRLTEGKM